nr:unnamed protein product [Digitaria exilis]
MKVPPATTMGAKRTRLKEEESGGLLQPVGPDLISRLPDEVLGDIISLLSTGEGARTQAISRRWRPLWRAAPLNLEGGDYPRRKSKRAAWVTKILSEHAGPGRCFNLYGFCLHERYAMVDGWLRSGSLTGLQEIDFSGADFSESRRPQPMPPSALRFAATLRFAWFSSCDFPGDGDMPPALDFPHLKKLLRNVTVSEDALHILLSGCSVLEILLLNYSVGFSRLRIRSPSLRSIGFIAPAAESSVAITFQELVIEDAPCLERLLPLNPEQVPATIRVMQAPKLQTVGLLSPGISRLEFGKAAFQILALESLGPNLDSVVDFLKCFPCVEKLYLTCNL